MINCNKENTSSHFLNAYTNCSTARYVFWEIVLREVKENSDDISNILFVKEIILKVLSLSSCTLCISNK